MGDDPLVGQEVTPPPAMEVDGEEEHEVAWVAESELSQTELKYVKLWTGYDTLSWEHPKYVDGLLTVGEFHEQYYVKPRPLEDVLGGPWT
jgi:hypothetical protein